MKLNNEINLSWNQCPAEKVGYNNVVDIELQAFLSPASLHSGALFLILYLSVKASFFYYMCVYLPK